MNQLSITDQHWLELIQQCRTSGKSDNQWLKENNISSGTFYYHISKLRKKSCDIPSPNKSGEHDKQEVVPLSISEPAFTPEIVQDTLGDNSIYTPAIRLSIKGISIEIFDNASQDVIQKTLSVLQTFC